jgi:hypothetical protein
MSEIREESEDNFKVSQHSIKQVDVLLNLDKDDEALTKWKEQLLGKAAEVYSRKIFDFTATFSLRYS